MCGRASDRLSRPSSFAPGARRRAWEAPGTRPVPPPTRQPWRGPPEGLGQRRPRRQVAGSRPSLRHAFHRPATCLPAAAAPRGQTAALPACAAGARPLSGESALRVRRAVGLAPSRRAAARGSLRAPASSPRLAPPPTPAVVSRPLPALVAVVQSSRGRSPTRRGACNLQLAQERPHLAPAPRTRSPGVAEACVPSRRHECQARSLRVPAHLAQGGAVGSPTGPFGSCLHLP